ncbi:hypothetical protein [Psychromonas hadalis]|uniref:hypothetical protein n=1 Tax=Psychromonas hadalis TaxID=211669 RepID=UPI0003B48AD9|nr:hypothetical protein [Psychromonas hadalis]
MGNKDEEVDNGKKFKEDASGIKYAPHEEYLLRTSISKAQVNLIKCLLGIGEVQSSPVHLPVDKRKRWDIDFDYFSDVHLKKLLNKPFKANYAEKEYGSYWAKTTVGIMEPAITPVDKAVRKNSTLCTDKSTTALTHIINAIAPLESKASGSNKFLPVTLLLPELSLKNLPHDSIPFTKSNWQHYTLSAFECGRLIKKDDEHFILRLFLAFYFMGLASGKKHVSNNSDIFLKLLLSSGQIDKFIFYHQDKKKDNDKNEDIVKVKNDDLYERKLPDIYKIFANFNAIQSLNEDESASLGFKIKILLPSKLMQPPFHKFEYISANKDLQGKDKNFYTHQIKNYRSALNYLLPIVKSGTAITFNIPIEHAEDLGEDLLKKALTSPLIILPTEWRNLLLGAKGAAVGESVYKKQPVEVKDKDESKSKGKNEEKNIAPPLKKTPYENMLQKNNIATYKDFISLSDTVIQSIFSKHLGINDDAEVNDDKKVNFFIRSIPDIDEKLNIAINVLKRKFKRDELDNRDTIESLSNAITNTKISYRRAQEDSDEINTIEPFTVKIDNRKKIIELEDVDEYVNQLSIQLEKLQAKYPTPVGFTWHRYEKKDANGYSGEFRASW